MRTWDCDAPEICSLALTCLLICFAVASDVSAQTPVYGGQVVQELMPPPSDTIFLPPGQSNLPFEPAPMFTSPGTHTSDVYASHPIVVQPPTPAATSGLPPGVRKGLFQKVFFTGTYIPQFDDDSFGFGDLEAGVVLGVPLLRPSTPLLITPRFAVHYLDRPGTLDLPEEVYDAEVSFRHLRKFGEGPWAMNAAITLGHYSDFEASDADAFRVTGQAFAVYESSPAWTWVFGVVYLNRRDLSVIPAVGAIYKPHADLKFDAILPRPRISWRLPDGLLASNTERWAYVGGEFGGGIWSIDRSATVGQDLMTYNDFRLLMGIETKADLGAISHRLEFGYVFGRELEFSSATPNVELDDSLFVRVGLKY